MNYSSTAAVQDVCMDQPVKVANPARGQLNRENEISLSLFAPVNLSKKLVSRVGFGSPVPRQPAHYPRSRPNLVLAYGIPPDFRGGVHLFFQTAIRHRSRVLAFDRICPPILSFCSA